MSIWKSIVNFFASLWSKPAPAPVPTVPAPVPQTPVAPDPVLKDETPWITWIEKHIGELQVTGSPATPFVKEIFSHTDLGPVKTCLASCAATLCAALEESGYKSTHNASAISYKDYGTQDHFRKGAIIVLEHPDGSHHVTCCLKDNGDGTIYTVGGNQYHIVAYKNFSKSQVIAVRWPVK